MATTKLFLLAGSDNRNTELRDVLSRANASEVTKMIKSKTSGSRNILHTAAEMGCVQNLGTIISALTKHGLLAEFINSKCKAEMTPLHYAAKAHAKGCVKFLVDHGANVNAVNKTKNTPLHLASANFQAWMLPGWFVNSFECIKVLMDADGMDLTLKNLEGATPLGISPSVWINTLKPSNEKSPRTPQTNPTTPITPATERDNRAEEGKDTNQTEGSSFLELGAAPDPVPTTLVSPSFNGRPIQNIRPLFDKDAKAENRAASMRLMLQGEFVTLHPVTKAVVDRKEFVIKCATSAENTQPTEENLIALKRECDVYRTMQLEGEEDKTGCVSCYTAHPEFNYLLLERFGRDIRSLIANKTKHPEELFEGIAQAVRKLHSLEIVHGDIKPQNILYEVNPVTHEFVVKLCDLDCARRVGEECPAVEIGTKRYVAPEVYKAAREGKTIKASLAFDMFSLGLVLWQVVQGSVMPALPSPDTAEEDLLKFYTDQQYLWNKMPLDPSIAYLYAPFVQGLTALDPAERMTAEQLKGRIGELSPSYLLNESSRKAEENKLLKKHNEELKATMDEQLGAIAIDVKTVMHEQRYARAEVDGMLRTLITNTHSIPTLAVILPKVDKTSLLTGCFQGAKPMHIFKNRFRLFFLCAHTREMVRCGPKGRGYKITVTKQWVVDAAPVLIIGLALLKLGLSAAAIPAPVPDISPLLRDREMYGKYVDAALSFVVDNGPSNISAAGMMSIDEAINSSKSLDVQTMLDAYANGAQLEEGSRKAYETIQALLMEQGKGDIVDTCGLKMVTYKGKTAWIKDDPNVIRQFEESMRY